jgi:hypothetical protein
LNLKTVIAALFKVFAFVLTLAVLFPSAVKLNHAFTHHTHEVCENDATSTTHFHETDLDCDFYKFKLSETHYLELKSQTTTSKELINKTEVSYYSFLQTHQQSKSYLRGPPSLI